MMMMATDLEPMDFAAEGANAFDVAAAIYLLAHDYGLYAVAARLTDLDFRPPAALHSPDDLEAPGRIVYDVLEDEAHDTRPLAVPEWADHALRFIESEIDS